jgi:hypothetical protein
MSYHLVPTLPRMLSPSRPPRLRIWNLLETRAHHSPLGWCWSIALFSFLLMAETLESLLRCLPATSVRKRQVKRRQSNLCWWCWKRRRGGESWRFFFGNQGVQRMFYANQVQIYTKEFIKERRERGERREERDSLAQEHEILRKAYNLLSQFSWHSDVNYLLCK